MTTLNGMYSPATPPFNFMLFLFMEIITFLVEWFILYGIFHYTYSRKNLDFWDACLCALIINLVSAIFAIPVWSALGVGL